MPQATLELNLSYKRKRSHPVYYALGFLGVLLRIVDIDTAVDWVVNKGYYVSGKIVTGDEDGAI